MVGAVVSTTGCMAGAVGCAMVFGSTALICVLLTRGMVGCVGVVAGKSPLTTFGVTICVGTWVTTGVLIGMIEGGVLSDAMVCCAGAGVGKSPLTTLGVTV